MTPLPNLQTGIRRSGGEFGRLAFRPHVVWILRRSAVSTRLHQPVTSVNMTSSVVMDAGTQSHNPPPLLKLCSSIPTPKKTLERRSSPLLSLLLGAGGRDSVSAWPSGDAGHVRSSNMIKAQWLRHRWDTCPPLERERERERTARTRLAAERQSKADERRRCCDPCERNKASAWNRFSRTPEAAG